MSDIKEELLMEAVREFGQLVQQGHIICIGSQVAYDDTVDVTRVRTLIKAVGVHDHQDLTIHHDRCAFEEFKAKKAQGAN